MRIVTLKSTLTKADKVSGTPTNKLASLNASGNLENSGISKTPATSVEIDTGTENGKFVTPAGLADSYLGSLDIDMIKTPATSAEINTGTNNTKYVTPVGLEESYYGLIHVISGLKDFDAMIHPLDAAASPLIWDFYITK